MHTEMEKDIDIVAPWLKLDPIRWTAGAMAGAFGGVVALALAAIYCRMQGAEALFTVKLMALPFLGSSATEVGMAGAGLLAVVLGFVAFELLAAFLGAVFAHFTFSNAPGPLLGMGFTWGAFSWIFINNLFSPSFLDIRAAALSRGAGFGFWMAYGLSLMSVAFFDRMLRGKSS